MLSLLNQKKFKFKFNKFMKKIFILIFTLSVMVGSLNAQQWVSTSPQNKKVILEEFTGQTCQFCPDGHKIAEDLKKANEGNVFLINIHSGGYATPSATYPMDLRTTSGDAIDDASGLTGYPAGSVNRADNPWAINRGSWGTKATSIMSQTSPVNVFVKSSVDKDTRMLTTEVEVYYTSNGPGTSNKLTVALVQNGILGKQVDGGNFNPTNWYNGQYIHNHALRMHITSGAWGVALDTITSGKYYKKTFYTMLPANVANVPLDIYNLEVIAFVAEANNNILSGHGTLVTHNNPNIVDLSMKDTSILPRQSFLDPNTKWCENKVTPRAKVTNNSTTTITSFTMTATVNGTAYPKTFTGTLEAGKSTILDWGQLNVSAEGLFTYKIDGFTNINGGTTVTDNKLTNNGYSTTLIGIKPNAFTTMQEGFDTTYVKNLFVDNSENPNASVIGYTNPSGAESTKKSLRIPLLATAPYNASNTSVHVVFGEADLRSAVDPKLTYYYAYSDGVQGGSAPSVITSYSTDCGTSWTDLNTTTCVSTGTAAAGYFYVPVSTDYKQVEVNLSTLVGKSVLLRITGKASADGNTLYLDQIQLKNSGGSGGGSAMDSFHEIVGNVTTAASSSYDVKGGVVMTRDSMYTWKITSINLPTTLGWKLLTICDAVDCVNYPAVQRNSFKATGNVSNDIYKITIDHNKKAGYGYVILKAWRGKDSTSTTLSKDYKFSLLTTTGSSISLLTDADEKLLYYFDNKIFVDREFKNAQLEVYDIKGQRVMDTKVTSDNIDFDQLTKGIYIARVIVDGQVAKTHKFDTSK